MSSPASAALLVALLLAPAAGADWLQTGHDAGGTGFAALAAPAWPDVALRVPLAAAAGYDRASSNAGTSVVVVDGVAYVGVSSTIAFESAVVRVDLASGAVDAWPSRGNVGGLASDGAHLFVGESGTVAMFDLTTGQRRWASPVAVADTASEASLNGAFVCPELRATEADVVAGCVSDNSPSPPALVLAALDRRTGEVRWRWSPDAAAREPDGYQLQTGFFDRVERAVAPGYVLDGLAVGERTGFLTIRKESIQETDQPGACSAGSNYYALDLESQRVRQLTFANGAFNNRFGGPCVRYPAPVVADGRAWIAAVLALYSIDEGASDLYGPGSSTFPLDEPSLSGAALAYDGRRLYAPTGSTLLAIEADLASRAWQFDLEPSETWVRGPTILAGARLHAQSSAGLLYSIETSNGAVAWTFPGRFLALAAAEGLLVGVTPERDLVVLGDASYGLRPSLAAVNAYARPGDEVQLDLSASPASPLGAPTSYRVEWGDGSSDAWQESPLFVHRYAAPGDHVARAYARNDAGQTGSVLTTYRVGQRDPAVTIWNSPLDSEYQETTFFLLGLLVTGAVAAVGIHSAGRKRRRFHRELAALEVDHDALRDDARACDAMLAKRRASTRALFLERRIEEAHASFLVARVEELRKNLRLGTVEERLKFLPYGMVLHLQRLLADARVDAYEHEHFLAALDAEASLTARQKAEVRKLIDRWFAHDADVRP